MFSSDEQGVSLASIITLFKSNNYLFASITTLQETLVSLFINYESYLIISQRIKYFDQLYENGVENTSEIKRNAESCSGKLYRALFTNNPHPLLSDYRRLDTDYHQLGITIVHKMRCQYGFDPRPTKIPKVSLRNPASEIYTSSNSTDNNHISGISIVSSKKNKSTAAEVFPIDGIFSGESY